MLGPLQIISDWNDYIIVLYDYFSKWVEAQAVSDHQAFTVSDKIVSQFMCTFGVSKQNHTDHGREFESEVFSTLCQK